MVELIRTRMYLKRASKIMGEEEREDIEWEIMQNPLKGVVIQGTGGARKIRAAAQGKGKRAGVRVIYYYATKAGKVYLFSAYAKNQQSDLSVTDKKELTMIIRMIERDGYEH